MAEKNLRAFLWKILEFIKKLSYKSQKTKVTSMQILMIPFEEPITIMVENETVKLLAFKTSEHGNIKFGVEAPRSLKVHREEIYFAIKEKELIDSE